VGNQVNKMSELITTMVGGIFSFAKWTVVTTVGSATVIAVLAVMTKPTNRSAKDAAENWLANNIANKRSLSSSFLSKVVVNLSNIDIRDIVIFKVAKCNFQGEDYNFLGAFGTWYPLQ
jgi:hypothetical protein